jgi:hypothetical protein
MAKKGKKTSSPAVLVTRIVVFGVLALLLVFAGLDYRAKKSAQATADAFRKAIQDGGDEYVRKSLLKTLIQGSPVVSSVDPKSTTDMQLSVAVEAYVWKGILRNYAVRVGYGPGDDPPVENIDGPTSGG